MMKLRYTIQKPVLFNADSTFKKVVEVLYKQKYIVESKGTMLVDFKFDQWQFSNRMDFERKLESGQFELCKEDGPSILKLKYSMSLVEPILTVLIIVLLSLFIFQNYKVLFLLVLPVFQTIFRLTYLPFVAEDIMKEIMRS
ncbi:hypothetical protein [Pedobacter sp. BMA]|uniref:hypothetical protein n=1 Tax=Pedobacter sp. BMA TaxID=1663685 RepID=UPI00064B25CD|nr:hypothetical protein [Pedobacter sp. BMA]KLT65392.1 hypothetical protein AB669_09880 [Pedobacter sp. BMA]